MKAKFNSNDFSNTLATALRGLPGGVCFVSQSEDGEVSLLTSPMMSRHDAAKYIGCGQNALAKSNIRKRGTGHRPYHVADLDAWLERRGRV